MSSFETFLNSFDPIKKGIQFEHFVKWFLKNDPEWITQVDEVWMWDEYPDRWGPDCGVDLVFKHKNGETWAVQAKCYDAKYSITKKDVDTFLSESNRNGIDKRLLIASTDRVARNAKQVCQAQEKPVILYLYADFDKAAIDYPSDISQLNSAKRKELPKPRPHQTKAIKDVTQGFKSDDRGQMIMACGTGKTYTTLWVKEALDAKTTLVLLPSLSLLSQTLREWTSAASQQFEALCVCSDETVGRQSNTDELVSSVQDVAFPTTSEPQIIKEFLDRDIRKVVFSTYHSSPLIAEAQNNNNYQTFDLIIADEAHRCTGEAGKAFTTVLNDGLIKAEKRLFTTATPRTYSTNLKKKASEMGVDIADMSDETSFGKVFHNLTFGQAVDDELLTDYRVVIIGVDEPMISSWIENRELVRVDDGETTDAKTLASQIGLIKAIKDYDLKRMITFHSRVKGAERFAKDLHNVIDFVSDEHRPEGEIYTGVVSGKMSSYDRGLKLSQLKELSSADRGLLTNARCLSEGVDVPSLDGVAFIDPRSSRIDIVQAVGRAIRKSDNKTKGTIVLPVFIEDTDNAEESLQSSNFKPIWDVLNALKSHDETLSLELNQLRTNLGRQGGGSVENLPEKIVFDLPKTVDNSFSDSLKTLLIEQTTPSWNFWYGILEAYAKQEGNARPKQKYKSPDGFKLGSWVGEQRSNQNILNPGRIKKLESLSGWVWNSVEYLWEEGYNHLQDFVKDKGHALPLQSHISPDGFKLGVWTSTRRANKKQLTPERIKALESLAGWAWNVKEYKWSVGFLHLQEFVDANGHAKIPESHISTDGFKLGNWLRSQKQMKSTLTSSQIRKLESLNGWFWNRIDFEWEVAFSHIQDYASEEGHARPVRHYKTVDGYKLGEWIVHQRSLHKKDKLTPERQTKLESLAGWTWDTRDYKWKQGFSHLQEFTKKEGHAKIPNNHISTDGYKIGYWVYKQRSNKNKLTSDQIKVLESLDGWLWNAVEDGWGEGYAHLQEFVDANGHVLVPQKHISPDGYKLGSWVTSKRAKKEQLTPERIEALESLAGWVWNARENKWNVGFLHLQEFVDANGHAKIPENHISTDEFKLGNWVRVQKNVQKKDKLTPERQTKLESLQGWAWRA